MSILTPPTNNLTPEQATAEHIRESARRNYRVFLAAQKRGIEVIWQNAAGLTPQQCCDSLGTDAARVFRLHGLLTDFIVAVQQLEGLPVDIATPTHAFTLNADGTVTVDTSALYIT